MTAVEIIRLIGGEFKTMDDETINKWLEVVRPMVSKKQFGKLYEHGLAYLVCHKMKMAGLGENRRAEAASALGQTKALTSQPMQSLVSRSTASNFFSFAGRSLCRSTAAGRGRCSCRVLLIHGGSHTRGKEVHAVAGAA